MATPLKFLIETKDELQKVVWPSRNDIVRLTFIVIFVSTLVALYIGALDFSFAKITETLLR